MRLSLRKTVSLSRRSTVSLTVRPVTNSVTATWSPRPVTSSRSPGPWPLLPTSTFSRITSFRPVTMPPSSARVRKKETMALTAEELQQVLDVINNQPKPEAPEPTPEQAAQDRVSVVGKPDTDPEAGPEYWIHLADGEVLKSFDSASTHVNGVLVIGRYQVVE